MRTTAMVMGAAIGVLGCGASAPWTPVEVVDAHVHALKRGDRQSAWDLLSPEAQARAPQLASPDRFSGTSEWVETRREARWGKAAADGPVLVRGAAGWQVLSGVLGLTRAKTPEQALATFSRALLASDWETLLQLLPDESRAQWMPEDLARAFAETSVEQAWRSLAGRVRSPGATLRPLTLDRVEAIVGESTILLVREHEAWKVFDVQPAKLYMKVP